MTLAFRSTLLLGVPTNAQLTITLLRIGEANKAPLPPPPLPPLRDQPPQDENDVSVPQTDAETWSNDDSNGDSSTKSKKGSKLIGLIKDTLKVTVQGAMVADYVRAIAGSERSKLRLGAVGRKPERETDGPASFTARHHGKKGHVIVTASATQPCVSFVRHKDSPFVNEKPIFTIAIDDIPEIRKIGGYGWKGKLIVGWVLSSEVADGIEITDKSGAIRRLTAVPRRDEVFNRLIAVSPKQYWESW